MRPSAAPTGVRVAGPATALRGGRRRRAALLGAAFGLFCGVLPAAAAGGGVPDSLDTRYFHRSWRRVDGLPGNSVYAIVQSAEGYLWIASENGVGRFDGKGFTLYGHHPAGVFGSRFLAALAVGREGSLWIGTERGLLRMRGSSIAADGAPGTLGFAAAVSALAEDAGGAICGSAPARACCAALRARAGSPRWGSPG